MELEIYTTSKRIVQKGKDFILGSTLHVEIDDEPMEPCLLIEDIESGEKVRLWPEELELLVNECLPMLVALEERKQCLENAEKS